MGKKPKVVTTGLKLYSVEIAGQHERRIIIKDSLNFFTSRLAELPETFGLTVDPKPFFPYLFIKRRNLKVTLPHLPPKKFYGYKWFKESDRKEFLAWYDANVSTSFNLREQLILYCANDVRILTLACVRFREQLRAITTRVDPFVSASTIARLTMNIFRTEFLAPNCIINLPEGGINHRGKQSYAALRFFRTLEYMFGWTIQTAEEGEHRAPPDPVTGAQYLIDGWTRLPDGQMLAIEFYGCWVHG